MSRAEVSGFRNIDWVTFSIYIGLVTVGWLMIYAVGYDEETPSGFLDLNTEAGKQTLWLGVSAIGLILTLIIDFKFWRTFAYLIYVLSMLLLIGVLFFGINIKGATSWFSILGFTLQPSEFAKFGTCLAVSAYLSAYSTDIKTLKGLAIAFGLFLLPATLILLQPDAGSALVFAAFMIVLYREGLSSNLFIFGFAFAVILILGLVINPMYIILGLFFLIAFILILNNKEKMYWLIGLGVLLIISIFVISLSYLIPVLLFNAVALLALCFYQYQKRHGKLVLKLSAFLTFAAILAIFSNYTFNNVLQRHQQDRINVWLRPSLCDPQGSLYNVLQSKMTIGSGGLEGKGFLQGTMTKLNYVPEQSTDFIFCTVGEEQGFIGSLGIIGLYLLLLSRIIFMAERQRSDFTRHYAYGVASILFLHFFVNIGMTMGLVPIIGIPLPFISYGGSSILGFTLMMGVLLKLDAHRLSG